MVAAMGDRANAGGEDEEDYMSDNYLVKTVDQPRPGVSRDRVLRLEREREAANARMRLRPRKADLEKERRDEALATPVGEDSKGFALLAKMGYRPGMRLGKARTEDDPPAGIAVPIGIELKTDRTGLGHASDQREQGEKRARLHVEVAMKRAKIHNAMIDDFRDRRRVAAMQKRVIGEICKCRRVCADLDARLGLEVPVDAWFWPSFPDPSSSSSASVNEGDEEETRFVYANGKPAPSDEPLEDFSEDLLLERLSQIIAYLRATHFYCIYCGQQFATGGELQSTCPGASRDDHDDLD